MSLMQSLFETAARYLPDKRSDPFWIARVFWASLSPRVDGEVKVKGRGAFYRRVSTARDGPCGAGIQHDCQGYNLQDRYRKGQDAPAASWRSSLIKTCPVMKAPPLVDINDLKKGMAASDLPILQDPSVHWDGQPVAVVVAETLEQAEHAASLVEVEYKAEEPAVSFDGMKPAAVVPSDVHGRAGRALRSGTSKKESKRRM